MTMNARTVLTAALVIGVFALPATGQTPMPMPHGGAGEHHGSMMAQMEEIHALFMNHEKMTRTVTNLPNGVRTVTESTDPSVAKLLQAHVVTSRQRVDSGIDPGLPMESDALHAIYAHSGTIATTVDTTPTGVVVTQTSDVAAAVTALQQHAAEVTTFVNEGMEAMHKAMMARRSAPDRK